MVIKEFGAVSFRNYKELFLSFSTGIYLIVGDNGQGKTNLAEGIYFLGQLASFRTHRLSHLITFGDTQAFLQGLVNKNDTEQKARIEIFRGGRRAWLDSHPVEKLSAYISLFQSLLFNPDSLYNYRNFPAQRRQFHDRVLSSLDFEYLEHLRDFRRVQLQKNRLLKKDELSTLNDWNQLFIEKACVIIKKRFEIEAKLNNLLPEILSQLTGREAHLKLEYRPTLTGDREADWDKLEAATESERQAGHALYGPHRDDFSMVMEQGREEAFFSQGESRIAFVALLLALNDVVAERAGYHPTIILDDLYSELDATVQENLTHRLSRLPNQIFITTTHPAPALGALANGIMEIREGRVV